MKIFTSTTTTDDTSVDCGSVNVLANGRVGVVVLVVLYDCEGAGVTPGGALVEYIPTDHTLCREEEKKLYIFTSLMW